MKNHESQQITPEIKRAILQWYRECRLRQADVAEKVGISAQSVSQWFSGESKRIRRKNWERLYPYIAKYLPDDITVSGSVSINNSGIFIDKNVGRVHQVNHGSPSPAQPPAADAESLMDQILESPSLSAEAKIELIKILKKESRKQE